MAKVDYSKWKRSTFKVTSLNLDVDNIRLDIAGSSSDEIITDLFINENAFQIVKSIVEDGFFPDELPIVIKEKGKWIVVEGNRRLAALKAIINPDIVSVYSVRIRNIIAENRFKPLKDVDVLIAPNRQSALNLLAKKHTSVTRRPWKPLRQAYFYYAQVQAGKTIEELEKQYPDVDLPKFVKMWEIHKIAKSLQYSNDEMTLKVHNQREFPITNLERLYDDPYFREYMGMGFNEHGNVAISSEKKSFSGAMTKVVEDIINKTLTSRTINDLKAKKKYVNTIAKPAASGKGAVDSSSFTPKKTPAVTTPSSLVPGDLVCGIASKGVQRMYVELKTINYRKYPNASLDLLRSLLECSLKAYFELKGVVISPRRAGGYVYLEDVLDAFRNDASTPKALIQVVDMIKSNKGYFPESKGFLDGINHNHNIFAVDKDIKTAWDKMESIFRYILR